MNITSKAIAGAIVGALIGLAGVTAAHAAPVKFPVDVVVHTIIPEDGEPGPAAFEGNIPGCETGTVVDVGPKTRFTKWGGVFVGTKVFTCENGEDGFAVRLNARFGENGSTGSWNLTDAWGAFAGTKASGSLTGTPTDGGIDDRYTGTAR